MRDLRDELWHCHRMSFDRNDRKAIEDALTDANPNNAIALAVATRIEAFTLNLVRQAERNGKWPTSLLLCRPETAFDESSSSHASGSCRREWSLCRDLLG